MFIIVSKVFLDDGYIVYCNFFMSFLYYVWEFLSIIRNTNVNNNAVTP